MLIQNGNVKKWGSEAWLIWIYFFDKNPIPATKRPIPDANMTESKPLSCHSFTKYTIKAKTDTNQSHFKYFIMLN